MKLLWQCGWLNLLVALSLWISSTSIGHAQVRVVNMIPAALSDEAEQNSEPNVAVNPANPSHIAASTIISATGFCFPSLAPIFVSADGGDTWALNCIVPRTPFHPPLDDRITLDFSRTTNNLYVASRTSLLSPLPSTVRLNILGTSDFLGPTPMTVLRSRLGNPPDQQPWVEASTLGLEDRLYVGSNRRFGAATIDQSLNAATLAPAFDSIRIEVRDAWSEGVGPPVRPAIADDDRVYAAFFGQHKFIDESVRADLVVVRDNDGGTGPDPFTNLMDDGHTGRLVFNSNLIPFTSMGQESTELSLSIAVDPNNSSRVYIAWGGRVQELGVPYGLRVQRSTNGGDSWSPYLRTIPNATNPALAINSEGVVGFLYQQVVLDVQGNERWETHIELTNTAFSTPGEDVVLATVPADTPERDFLPYIGDYVDLVAVGTTFHGVFSANNTPDNAHFPNGVTYQRNADFLTHTLLDDDDLPVDVSIDPFFFQSEPRLQPPEPAAQLTVNKVLIPHTDPGLFNLQIDDSTVVSDPVGDGGSSGPQSVDIGSHNVDEAPAPPTKLADYATDIAGFCFSDGSIILEAGENRICTIINRNIKYWSAKCASDHNFCTEVQVPNEESTLAGCQQALDECLELLF